MAEQGKCCQGERDTARGGMIGHSKTYFESFGKIAPNQCRQSEPSSFAQALSVLPVSFQFLTFLSHASSQFYPNSPLFNVAQQNTPALLHMSPTLPHTPLPNLHLKISHLPSTTLKHSTMQREPAHISHNLDDDVSSHASSSNSSVENSPVFSKHRWPEFPKGLPAALKHDSIPDAIAAGDDLASYFTALSEAAITKTKPSLVSSHPETPGSFISNTEHTVSLSDQDSLNIPPDFDADFNRKIRVTSPNGDVFASVVCPFDDRVHYNPQIPLEEYSSEHLSESDIVFSKEFAQLSVSCRVLSMALDPTVPLLDRFKFLCLVSFYLDEHFSKRLGHIPKLDLHDLESAFINLRRQVRPPTKYEEELTEALRTIVEMQHKCLNAQILPKLAQQGVEIAKGTDLTVSESQRMTTYFRDHLLPAITPFMLDATHPFPLLQSHEIYVYVSLFNPRQHVKKRMVFKVPVEERLIPLNESGLRFVTTEDVCLANLNLLCQSMVVISAHVFRVTRNTKISIDDNAFGEMENLLDFVIEEVHRRRQAPSTRLEVLKTAPEKMIKFLMNQLHLDEMDVYVINSPVLDLSTCMTLAFVNLPWLRQAMREPVVPAPFKRLTDRLRFDPGAIFGVLRKKDVLVEYPKENFENSAVLYLHAAARDPCVRSVKTVLYRGGSNSPIIAALIRAAKNGKEVSVVVELKASLDEVQNSDYARALQLAGCNVTYGVLGLKVHSKIMLVTRQEDDGKLLQYAIISTGNFNPKTAKLYSDLSLFTCRKEICSDVRDVFNSLTGYSWKPDYRRLLVAPVNMLSGFIDLIKAEAENARAGRPARIACQMNGLTDKQITKELYDASQAGVRIDLLVRGPCRLRPGIKGKSDNIRVYSWVGQLLQHQRVYYFHAGGVGKYFIGSADWRTRNITARVEVVVPIEDRSIRKRLAKVFELVHDMDWVWRMAPDGRYYKGIPTRSPPVSVVIAPARNGSEALHPTRNEPKLQKRRSLILSHSPHQAMLDVMFSDQKEPNGVRIQPLDPLPMSISESSSENLSSNKRVKPKIQVDVQGNKKLVDKVAVGAVPIKFEGDVKNMESVRILMVSGGENDPWALPKGGKNEGETVQQAIFRIAREKAGVSQSEEVANLGWILVSKRNKQMALQTFVLEVVEIGTIASSRKVRRSRWFTAFEALSTVKENKHDFSLNALERAIDVCRRRFGDNEEAKLSQTSGTPLSDNSLPSTPKHEDRDESRNASLDETDNKPVVYK